MRSHRFKQRKRRSSSSSSREFEGGKKIVQPPPDWETYYFHIKSKKTVAEEIVYDINLVDILDDIDQVTLDICSDSE